MVRFFLLRESVLTLLASSCLVACADDDAASAGAGGAGGAGGAAVVSGGSAGVLGSSGSSGSAGSGGSATASVGGAAGAAGAASEGGAAGAGGEAGAGSSAADAGGDFTLSSAAFTDNPGCGPGDPAAAACDLFPNENTGLGGSMNVSPALAWTGAPAGTLSFAIALHDLVYMPQGEPFTHWVMWNIPGSATGLPASLPAGAEPGVPSAAARQVSFEDDNRFTGSGACGNVYEFVLYALDRASFTPPDADPDAVENAIAGSGAVLATATMRGRSDPGGPCVPN
jgi:phosphatidylethanolamine-binding protein (PEBP) family uncharacterized protein